MALFTFGRARKPPSSFVRAPRPIEVTTVPTAKGLRPPKD